MKMKLGYLLAIGAIASLIDPAFGTPTLTISDGVNTISVSDNMAGDANAAVGQVTWIGGLDNWILNVDTGTSYPAIGTLLFPSLDLSFNAISNGVGGNLWISFSDNGFGPSAGISNTVIGGTVSGPGSVSFSTYGGNSNTLFDSTNWLSSVGPFTGPAFSTSILGGPVSNAGPYSLTEVVQITSDGAAAMTGDASLSVPDAGTTVMLLGAGLLGLALAGSLRRRVPGL
jgi:hypothetical protein